ncbi:MAG: FHA domain-containing protein, partial [Candidatus Binatia bacterium]
MPIPLDRDEVVLGRALETGVRINDTKVSRMHAVIKKTSEENSSRVEYVLTDMDSRNGTFLNGLRVNQEKLQNGDKIMIGEHIL